MRDFEYISSIENINPIYIWIIYALSFVYLFINLRKLKLSFISYIFIYISFSGLFEYVGGLAARFFDLSVFLLIWFSVLKRKTGKIHSVSIQLFIIFSLSYFFMTMYHGFSDPLSDLRQYVVYAIPFSFYILYSKVKYYLNYRNEMNIVVKILNTQIFASIIKLLLIGFNEKIVGTLSIGGGAIAAVFPIIYFMAVWYKKRGELKQVDWYWILASILVSVASNKRAVWFFFPVTIYLFFLSYKKVKLNALSIILLFLISSVFYFGVRFNPSLNPEREIRGSFNPNYVYNYVLKYNIGNQEEIDPTVATGRMGSNVYYLNELFVDFFNRNTLLGYGNAEFNKYGARDVENISKFGFTSKYMLTGWVSVFIKFGSIVLFVLLFSLFYMIRTVRRTRDFYLLLFVFGSWFFFYSGVIITTTLFIGIFMFTIFFVQYYHNRNIKALN